MNAADAIILATGSGLFSDFTRKFFLFFIICGFLYRNYQAWLRMRNVFLNTLRKRLARNTDVLLQLI